MRASTLTRRSFVAGSAAVLAAAGSGLVAAVGAAGAESAGLDAVGVPELSRSVTVGAATFAYPGWWQIASEQPDEDAVRIEVLDGEGGRLVGHLTITAGSPVEASRSWRFPHSVFAGLAASESSPIGSAAKSVWGLERIDRGDIPMARALCAEARPGGVGGDAESGAPTMAIGRLYMALAPDWTLMCLETLVEPSAFDALEPLVEAIWDSAAWPPAVTPGTVEAVSEDFGARALRRGQRRNKEHPYYNAHWDIVGFDCAGGSSYGENVYQPTNACYIFATPEGIEEREGSDYASALVQQVVGVGYDTPALDLWCMERVDSDGTPYLRSTVEVAGRGVIDIAYYRDIDPVVWYIAGTGEPVFVADYSGSDKEPWVLMSEQNGVDYEPWQDVPGG